MSITITATCGGKSVSIKCKRPSWDSVREAYEEINLLSKEQIDNAKTHIYDLFIAKGCDGEAAEEQANVYKIVAARYIKVGGGVYAQFINNMDKYCDTCALRVSYALNYSTHPINTMDKQVIGRGYQGGDKHTYYLGVFDVIELLKSNWKELSWNKSTYKQVKENIKRGCSEDFYKGMGSKKENQHFFKELQSIQRKGIVAMISTDGRLRHTTLWNGNDFVDVDFDYYNFLTETNYIVRDLYFWDLL